MGQKSGLNVKRVIILAGAVIAFTIGSGFATGQEIVQYYTSYGLASIGTVILFAVLFLYYNFNFARAGAKEKFEKSNDVYKFFCGKYIGTILDYYSTIFVYMSFWVMVGGASSTLEQAYGLPHVAGGIILAVLAVITVVAGLSKLVDTIGVVGPIIVIMVIIIAVASLVQYAGNFDAGLTAIANAPDGLIGATAADNIKYAADPNGPIPGWIMSALSYAGFVLLWFASFTAALGMNNRLKDVNAGIIGGTAAVCVAIVLVAFAQICNINTESMTNAGVYVWNADIPNLVLTEHVLPILAPIFSIVVFAGIYTTAVPLLYNPVSRFAEEGTARFRILAVVLGVAGLIIGLFVPFRVLVNVIYVINGYVGALLLIFMVVKNIRQLMDRKKNKGVIESAETEDEPAEEEAIEAKEA